jgi:hypothetical protein
VINSPVTKPRLIDVLPTFAKEVEKLLMKQNEPKLAAQLHRLRSWIVVGKTFVRHSMLNPNHVEHTVQGPVM